MEDHGRAVVECRLVGPAGQFLAEADVQDTFGRGFQVSPGALVMSTGGS